MRLIQKLRSVRTLHPRRFYAAAAAVLIVFSILPSMQLAELLTARKYQLDRNVDTLIGKASPGLAEKLVLDSQTGLYQFNAEGKKASSEGESPEQVAARLQKNVVGGKDKDSGLYSLELSPDSRRGITYYDNNSQLSFKLTPQFDKSFGRKIDDRLVYPMPDGSQAVYTVKSNGLKEDVVYQQAPEGGTVRLPYKFELPDTLQARLNPDGSVGVYSVDPMLFGDISFGGDADREKLESARRTAAKDHLVFALPRPVIVAADGQLGQSSIEFTLQEDTLVLHAEGLETIKGAFSLDPSVVVTSSSDFGGGNDEGGIEFNAGQIDRGRLSGGSAGAWSTQANLLARSRSLPVSTVYNGYIYITGGRDEETSVDLDTVTYAQINADGSGNLGPWVESPNKFANPRYYHSGAVYNGYLYVYGGRNAGGTTFGDVQFAKINADGTTGAWNVTTSYPGPVRRAANGGVYNGYLYHIGGFDGTYYNTVQYAPLNADGTVGTWLTTTVLPSARYAHALTFANGTAYVSGGVVSGGATTNTVFYGNIAEDGSIAEWTAAPNLPNARYQHNMVVRKGYLYMLSGVSSTSTPSTNFIDSHYAQINANGSIGPWQRTTDFNTVEMTSSALVTNGDYIYIISGRTATAFHKYVRSSRINSLGTTASYATTTALPTIGAGKSAIAGARYGHAVVAYNGFMYSLGGNTGSATQSQALMAPINANGTLGSWTATTAMPNAREYLGAQAHNGFMYIVGGFTGTGYLNDVQYAPIATDGTLGAWTAATSFATTRSRHTTAIHNGYMYVLGGWNGTTRYDDVQYALICTGQNNGVGGCSTTAGPTGAWAATGPFATARWGHTSAVAGGYIYVAGGSAASPARLSDVQYALICTGANSGVGGCTATAGTVGTWAQTTAFPTARTSHGSFVANGHMYIAGGSDAGSAGLSDVQYAPINADGTIGTWAASVSFATARDSLGAATSSGIGYIIGGISGTTAQADVQFATVNNGGAGTVGSWGTTTAFTGARYEHSSVVAGGYLYVLGGTESAGSTRMDTVYYAPINLNGTVGTWLQASSFATARSGHTSVVANGYMYVIGGRLSANLADVQYAKINADGSLGTWTATTSLPEARYRHGSAVHNGFVYASGGNGSALLNTVVYAPLNADGTIGVWTATSSFTTARAAHAALVYNGYFYIIGGAASVAFSDVQFAPINANGSLGSFVSTAPFVGARYYHGSFARHGFIYVIGGFSGSASYNTVQAASINGNGHLSAWSPTTTFTTARYGHAVAEHRGNVYMTGGQTTATVNEVLHVPQHAIARSAQYSKLIDLGTTTTIADITFTGSLPGGKSSIRYRTAGTDGVLGASQSAAVLSGACIGGGTTRYVLLSVLMDDSAQVVFPGTANRAAVQDLTVRYSSAAAAVQPQTRLRAGKFFSSESLQPLDIAKGTGAGAVTCN